MAVPVCGKDRESRQLYLAVDDFVAPCADVPGRGRVTAFRLKPQPDAPDLRAAVVPVQAEPDAAITPAAGATLDDEHLAVYPQHGPTRPAIPVVRPLSDGSLVPDRGRRTCWPHRGSRLRRVRTYNQSDQANRKNHVDPAQALRASHDLLHARHTHDSEYGHFDCRVLGSQTSSLVVPPGHVSRLQPTDLP